MSIIDLTSDFASVRDSRQSQDDVYRSDRNIDIEPEGGFQLNRGMVLTRALLIATGSYHKQVRRSFTANVGGDAVEDLRDITQDNYNVDILQLARCANEIIVPDTRIDRNIGIANGWDEPRFRFFIEFVKPLGSGASVMYCYTGYTDYASLDADNNVDPAMKLHITNVVTIANNVGTRGTINRSVRSDNNVVVASRFYEDETIKDRNGFNYDGADREYLIDPRSAVLGFYQQRDASEDIAGYEWQRDVDMKYEPGHSTIGNLARNVERSHSIPAFYLSKLINVTRNVKDEDDIYAVSSYGSDYGSSTQVRRFNQLLSIDKFSKDPLASLFREDTNIVSNATLHWHDLQEYWPDIDDSNKLSVILPAGMRQMGSSSRFESRLRDLGRDDLDSDEWDGGTQETIIATMISQQLPNIMLSEMIESIRFSVTNDTHSRMDSPYLWTVGDHRRHRQDNRDAISFLIRSDDSTFQQSRFQAFKMKFEEVLLRAITVDNMISINLTIDCDIRGTCRIMMNFNGGREYRFNAPTFAAPMTSGLITSDVDHYNDFTNNIVNLVDDIVNN